MTDLAEPRIERAAEEATRDPVEEGHGPTAKSDSVPRHTLREGHRVHALVLREDEDDTPRIEELHPADPDSDAGDTVSIDADAVPLRDEVDGDPSLIAAVEATLVADFRGDEPDRLTLTDAAVDTYTEVTSIPTP